MLNKDLFGKLQVTPQPYGKAVPVSITRKPENPNQLKLFMRPNEIMDTIKDSIDVGMVDNQLRMSKDQSKIMNTMWGMKRRELRGKQYRGLTESIKEHGVMRPVTIEDLPGEPLRMGQGHHRVVASAKVEKETGRQVYIPVVYDANYSVTDNVLKYPPSVSERQFLKWPELD